MRVSTASLEEIKAGMIIYWYMQVKGKMESGKIKISSCTYNKLIYTTLTYHMYRLTMKFVKDYNAE